MDDRFLGPLEFSFLGGAPGDLLLRAESSFGDSVSHARNITLSLAHDRIPSAALLPSHSRSPGLMGFLSLVVTPDLIKSRLREFTPEDVWVSEYETLDFFILSERWPRYSKGHPSWDDIGLKRYLEKAYPGQYRIVHSPDKMGKGAPKESVHCLFGRKMETPLMNEMLGAFLEGISFVLDTSGMDKRLLRRLEGFILENSLEVEFIRCHTQVRRVSLGTAMMILFDGNRLCGLTESMVETFWAKLTSVFEWPRQELRGDGEVEVVWMKRMPVQTELNFEEIRRAVLYNPSLRDKRVTLAPHKKFRFLKYASDYQATVTSISGGGGYRTRARRSCGPGLWVCGMSVRILYHCTPGEQSSFSYRPLVCLSADGPIAQEVLDKLYGEHWPDSKRTPRFKSFGDLEKFSVLLIQKMGAKYGHLLSMEAYNLAVQRVNDVEELAKIFVQYGQLIGMDRFPKESRRGKNLFFKRFFQ